VNPLTLGYAAVGGVAVFAAAVVALHVAQPALDPRTEAVSYYVHGRAGALLTVGLLSWGVASLALVLGLAKTLAGPRAVAGRWLLGVWGAGVLLGGIFPADPAGQWDKPPSLAGMIHGQAAMIAFLVFPIGALLLARTFRADARWSADATLYHRLAVASALSLALFFASLVPVFIRPGPPILLGLTERVLLAVYSAWIAVVGMGIARRA
jgi:hypothetical protein